MCISKHISVEIAIRVILRHIRYIFEVIFEIIPIRSKCTMWIKYETNMHTAQPMRS